MQHQSEKRLECDFGRLWERLHSAGEQSLRTPRDCRFVASATEGERGSLKGRRFIKIKQGDNESARIYACCWGHTTNHYGTGTRIGGYSDSLDSWCSDLVLKHKKVKVGGLVNEASGSGEGQNAMGGEDMNDGFKELVDRLPGLLEELVQKELRDRTDLGGIPEKGIYVFFEEGRPIYVGRSNRMKCRIQEHGRPSSTHNSAPFAFNVAKKAAGKKGVDVSEKRAELEKDQTFAPLFSEAKERVSRMWVRVIEIDDPILQTLFEVYACIALRTTEYNDFDTH